MDLVMGLRTIRRQNRILRIATMIYDVFVTVLFDSPLHTNSSSFIAFKAKYIKGIKLKHNDHRYLPLIAMNRGAFKLSEVIVINRERIHGHSKYGVYTKFLFSIINKNLLLNLITI